MKHKKTYTEWRRYNDLGGLSVDHKQICTCREEDTYQCYPACRPSRLFRHGVLVHHKAARDAVDVVDPLFIFRLSDLHLSAQTPVS